jgi:hypothetical protein
VLYLVCIGRKKKTVIVPGIQQGIAREWINASCPKIIPNEYDSSGDSVIGKNKFS